jgi:hypothetical protein
VKYAATASVRVRVEFDPPEPEEDHRVTEEMSEENAERVLEVRSKVATFSEEMVADVVRKALKSVGDVESVAVEQVAEVPS